MIITNLLIVLSLVVLIFCVYFHRSVFLADGFATGDICTVKLTNLNPMFVKNFQRYDGHQINCFNKLSSKAYCVGATMKIDAQPVDASSSIGYNAAKPMVYVTNSNGSPAPENAIIPLDPWEFQNFFCLS